MPSISQPTTALVIETDSQGNTPLAAKVAIFVVVGLVLSTAIGFIVWYKLSKPLRERQFKTGCTLAKNGYNELDKSNMNTTHSPVLPGDATLEINSFFNYPKEASSREDDAQEYHFESLRNPPFVNIRPDPVWSVSCQQQERTVDICHALESSKSCQILVEEWSSPIKHSKKGPMTRVPLSVKSNETGPPGLGWF